MDPCLLIAAPFVVALAVFALGWVVLPLIGLLWDEFQAGIQHRELERELRRAGYTVIRLSSSMFVHHKEELNG